MDLLGGYGSDEDETAVNATLTEDSQPVQNATELLVDGAGPEIPRTETAAVTDVASALHGLPAPRKQTRRPAKFRLPILIAPDSDSEDDRPKKKQKVSSKGLKLTEFLPAPVHEAEEPDTAGLLGSGFATGASRRMYDSDDDMAKPENKVELGQGNEAYRVFDAAEQDPAHAPDSNGVTAPYDAYASAPSGGAAQNLAGGDALLQQALQEEAARSAKNGVTSDPFSGVKLKEIKQDTLTYMPPEQKQAKNALRTAFGTDHEARVREEAGDAPEKTAKRKHQISSLYYQAKMKEMESIELRGQGLKTRRETQAKYGWF